MKRRDFLKVMGVGAAGLAMPGCEKLMDLLGAEKERLFGLNVHPFGGYLQDLQLRAIRELGVSKLRITLGIWNDHAGPYINSHPAQWMGIITDFDMSRLNARDWPNLVRNVVARTGNVACFQVLNEPWVFMRMTAQDYVANYLAPAYSIIKSMRPSIPVVAAAPQGTQDGYLYFQEMSQAGANQHCDYRGIHLYLNNSESYIIGDNKPVMITETGTVNRAGHVGWWKDTMPHFGKVLDTTEQYWYVLLDRPDGGYSLISEQPDAAGNPIAVSPLYNYIRDNY